MTQQAIVEKLHSILLNDFEVPAARLEAGGRFREDLGLDSLEIVDMVILLHKDLGFELPLSRYEGAVDVDSLARIALQHVSAP